MTVAELIEELKKYPQELPVFVFSSPRIKYTEFEPWPAVVEATKEHPERVLL